jgi:hypothetical protein
MASLVVDPVQPLDNKDDKEWMVMIEGTRGVFA